MTIDKRTPDEIMAVIDQAQERLGPDFDLRSLVWDVIEDVIDSARLATYNAAINVNQEVGMQERLGIADVTTEEVIAAVEDYVSNHYGDL